MPCRQALAAALGLSGEQCQQVGIPSFTPLTETSSRWKIESACWEMPYLKWGAHKRSENLERERGAWSTRKSMVPQKQPPARRSDKHNITNASTVRESRYQPTPNCRPAFRQADGHGHIFYLTPWMRSPSPRLAAALSLPASGVKSSSPTRRRFSSETLRLNSTSGPGSLLATLSRRTLTLLAS